MSMLVRLGAMLVAMTVITASAISMADAQEKPKDTKKPAEKAPEKAPDKAPEKAGKVEVYKAKDGYRFRILDADGKTIAMASKGYDKKDDVIKVLEQLKATMSTAKIEVKEEKKEEKKP